jgi:hypothetical protein
MVRVREGDMHHPADEFAAVSSLTHEHLAQVVDRDWSVRAGTLDWNCSQTADHMVDCVFSYAMQLAARASSGFLPFHELHALPEATPLDLVQGLRAVAEIFVAVLRCVPEDAVSSDGVLELEVNDWAKRGGYEVLLHTHDVLTGLSAVFVPPAEMCAWILGSQALWMLDRTRAEMGDDPWAALLLGSGRSVGTT